MGHVRGDAAHPPPVLAARDGLSGCRTPPSGRRGEVSVQRSANGPAFLTTPTSSPSFPYGPRSRLSSSRPSSTSSSWPSMPECARKIEGFRLQTRMRCLGSPPSCPGASRPARSHEPVAVRRRRTPRTPRSSRGSPRDPSGTRWSRRRARGSSPRLRRPCGSSRASSVSGAGYRRRPPYRPSRAVRAPRGTRNSGGVPPTRREDRSRGGRSELLLSSCPPVAPLPDMRVDGRGSESAGDRARGWLTLVLDLRSSGAWCGFHLECHTGAFAFEEPPLRFRAPFGGVVPEAARFRDHAVARDDDDHRVSRARGPDGAARSGPPEPSGDLPVRDRLARGNRPQELEDLSLEGRDLKRERNVLQIALSRMDMFEDPGQIWVLRSRRLQRSLASQPHRSDAVPQDLELDVQSEFAAELRVDLQRFSVFSAGTRADHREHRTNNMVLGPVQVLFECAPSDAERKTDLFRCRPPREFIVAGFVRREESPRLHLGEF